MSQSQQIRETETGRTRVRWDMVAGFQLVSQDAKTGQQRVVPIDPESIDALVAAWPAFRASLPSGAPAPTAPPATPSPSASKAGPAPTNSASPSKD